MYANKPTVTAPFLFAKAKPMNTEADRDSSFALLAKEYKAKGGGYR